MKNIYPSFVISPSFCLGILLSSYLSSDIYILFLILIIIFLFSFLNKLFLVSVILMSFILGVSAFKIKNEDVKNISKIEFEKKNYVGKIVDKLGQNKGGNKYLLEVFVSHKKIKIITYLPIRYNDSISIGDYIFFNKKISPINKKDILEDFDYKKFMMLKGITHSIVFFEREGIKIEKGYKNLPYVREEFKKKVIKSIENKNLSQNVIAFTIAMILGDKTHIDKELLEDYSNAGVSHILAVSGLHLGIIIMILSFLLFFMDRSKSLKSLKIIIIIVSIWLYAFLINFSPSITRACTMFTFIMIGNNLRRYSNNYNSLAISSILLLIINPNNLFDVGFQLSYLAVFFILSLYPLVVKLIKIKNKILFYFWKIISVSISAQIGVLPLTIYYFGKLPLLFLAGNVILIPIIGVVLFLGIVTIILSFTPYDLTWFYISYDYIVSKINLIINFIASFRKTVVYVNLEPYQIILFFLLLILGMMWLKIKRYLFILFFLLVILVFQTSILAEFFIKSNITEIVSFDTNKTLICLKNKRKVYIINDNRDDYSYRKLKSYLQKNSIIETYYIPNDKDLSLDFKGNKILVTKRNQIKLEENQNFDFCFFRDSFIENKKSFNFKNIILDKTNNLETSIFWEEYSKSKNFHFYSIYKNGSFISKLD